LIIKRFKKYTNEGFVEVNVNRDEKNIIVCVIDSGIGMSQEFQKKLFGKFVRDESIKKEYRGTGLGLYISKYIVEIHKGKIWAESEGLNKGSKFCISIPFL
jgi:signal transduction histidine kinase